MEIINRIYPGCRVVGCGELLVEGVGWYPVSVSDTAEIIALAKKGKDALGRNIRVMSIQVWHNGLYRQADFSPKELIQ